MCLRIKGKERTMQHSYTTHEERIRMHQIFQRSRIDKICRYRSILTHVGMLGISINKFRWFLIVFFLFTIRMKEKEKKTITLLSFKCTFETIGNSVDSDGIFLCNQMPWISFDAQKKFQKSTKKHECPFFSSRSWSVSKTDVYVGHVTRTKNFSRIFNGLLGIHSHRKKEIFLSKW